jgi:MraZ protein
MEACGMERMTRLSESIDSLDPYSEERDAFAATILGGSYQLPFDGEGRVILPENLMHDVGIKEQAIFVGKGVTFEIWEPQSFEKHANKAKEIAKQGRAKLRLTPCK